MDGLVANLVAAYRESIRELDWMGEETRAKALAKLDAFTPKIGYPDRWRDYSGARGRPRTTWWATCAASDAFEQDRELGKIGKPLDRDEWFMTPQTVNAYYNPGMNEIVFPAAILQPPFFDADADDAVNYGGIGAVIGHEIGHGFDDQGSKYDGDGRLEDWWTDDDRAEFEKRTKALIDAVRRVLRPASSSGRTTSTAPSPSARTSATSAGCRSRSRPTGSRSARRSRSAPVVDGLTGAAARLPRLGAGAGSPRAATRR